MASLDASCRFERVWLVQESAFVETCEGQDAVDRVDLDEPGGCEVLTAQLSVQADEQVGQCFVEVKLDGVDGGRRWFGTSLLRDA